MSEYKMDISKQKKFNAFIDTSTVYLLELNGNEIICHAAKKEKDYLSYVDHLKTLRKHVFPSPNESKNFTIQNFPDIIERFQKLQPNKKLFCINGVKYLVKKGFTEGAKYVKPGEIHSYKAIGRPLDIYISSENLDPNSFKSSYANCTTQERISPGEKKILKSNTYYIIIAPCHTCFIKDIQNTFDNEKSPGISPSFVTETDCQVRSYAEDRNGSPSSGRANRLDRTSTFPQPSTSRDDGHGNSTLSAELERFNRQEMINDSARTGTRRSSIESDRQSKRAKTSSRPRASTSQMEVVFVPQSPNSLRNEMELISYNQTINGARNNNGGRAVFAIRKNSHIESYALKPGSTFDIFQDNIMVGEFAIENEDMDPYVIEYLGDVQFIREVAKFKNGSVFETTLTVQKDLLNELRDPTKKREKVVVNYFFESAFKTVEAAYKKFSEMRNTKMIGSCVPAIIPLSDANFSGDVSDAYEAKP